MTERPWKPTKEQILLAKDKRVADVIATDLKVLFCGINPGLYTAAVGHHFARPGNRFWPALYYSGFTPRLMSPFEEKELLKLGLGITNIVDRATANASELSRGELKKGSLILIDKVIQFKPKVIAVLGIASYRWAFDKPKANTGKQKEKIGSSSVWVLPNPSGINANYLMDDLVAEFVKLRKIVDSR